MQTIASMQAYQIVALIETRVANYFGDRSSPNAPVLVKKGAISLQAQLQDSAQRNPSGVGMSFTSLSDILNFAGVLGNNKLPGLPPGIIDQADGFFRALMGGTQDPKALLDNVTRAIDGISKSMPVNGLAMLPEFIKGQLSIAISAASIFSKLTSPKIPQKIEDAYISYLFDEKGFQTIDGDSIAPPTHLNDFTNAALGGDLKTLKDAFSEKNAIRYVRDLVRLPVEAACDEAYSLNTLIDTAVTSNFPTPADRKDGKAKIIRWMKGFASMAEASVTGAVEEVCSGVGSFQTNQLVAAAAGTFAGTWARKVTQDIFLNEI
jgi:hypothetical protein